MSPAMSTSRMFLGDVDANTAHWLRTTYDGKVPEFTNRRESSDSYATAMAGMSGTASRSLTKVASQRVVKLDLLNSWEFDSLMYSKDELSTICTYILSILRLLEDFNVPMIIQQTFMHEIMLKYHENPYHNFTHGCDVFHTTYRLIVVPDLVSIFSPLETFALLIGALAHDVGHLGVNNAYLVKTRDNLALMHNDRSPLENMHCTILYDILRNEQSNIFATMDDSQWREARRIIISCILGTDMANHFDQISKAQVAN
jgi:hypothetical protein